mgnify:FL=1
MSPRSFTARTVAVSLAIFAMGLSPTFAKDQGPVSATCDQFEKSSVAWRECAAAAPASAGPAAVDAELFYAGYWLAKNGRYAEALDYLGRTRVRNARVLTYIGFATRKLGRVDEAMGYYKRALQKDPQNIVSRAYLGEAHLSRGNLSAASDELQRIEKSCGTACEPYRELEGHISEFRKARHERG